MNKVLVASNGAIFWDGFHKSPEEAARLAEQFESVPAGDWYRPYAQKNAADLRAALAQVFADEPQEKTLKIA